MPIISPQLAAYFNQVARPGDIAIVPARGASRMYSMINAGQKLALFTSWADAERQFDGLPPGTTILGYDPEHWDQTPSDEQQNLPVTVQKAETFAHAHGLKFLIAPDRRFDDQYLNVLAPHADIIVFQGQQLQGNPDSFASWAHSQIKVARAANPALQIFVQVGAPRGPATQMVTALHGIEGDIDGIAAWTNQQTMSTLQDFVTQVRA